MMKRLLLSIALLCAATAQAVTCPTFAAGDTNYITNLNILSAGCTPTTTSNTLPIAAAGGTVDAITATYTPAVTLTDKTVVGLVSAGASTSTTPTFAPNALTARTITARGGGALVAGDIGPAGFVALLEYNLANTRWELLNPAKVRAASDLVGTITTANIPNTAVSAGSYTGANITVDAQGRLTSAASGSGFSSPLTTKGDIHSYSSVDARTAVGTNGYVLNADSSAATGLAWVFPPSTPTAAAGGTLDAITATYSPAVALTNRLIVALVSAGENATNTPTFAPNGLTARTITARGGSAVYASDIGPSGTVHLLEYNSAGTNWELLNPAKVRAASDLTGYVAAANTPAYTGDITKSAGSVATTLATVNSNVGTFGSTTKASVFTVIGKGLITAASESTVTPAIGSITGLGTGVATAAAINTGSASSIPVLPRVTSPAYSSSITQSITGIDQIDVGTLTGNLTLTLSGGADGQPVRIRLKQDGTGSRLLTLDSKFRLGADITGVTLSTAANKTDYLGVIYHSSDDKYDVVAIVKGY